MKNNTYLHTVHRPWSSTEMQFLAQVKKNLKNAQYRTWSSTEMQRNLLNKKIDEGTVNRTEVATTIKILAQFKQLKNAQ